MFQIIKTPSTHSAQLERWLGTDKVEHLSNAMRTWYGPPIAVGGVPGAVYANRGGDFRGRIRAGYEATAYDHIEDFCRKAYRRWQRAARSRQLNAGFASLSDLISEATAGKSRYYAYQKVGPTRVASATHSLWLSTGSPSPAANASNAPTGDAPTDATTGAFPFSNPTGGDTQHFTTAWAAASAQCCLLLYDRIFQVNKTMASTANESVTGVPTRYQSSVATNMDYAGGNFIFVEVGGTQLAATAHNWGVAGGSNECLYRNQAATDNAIMPVLTGNSAAIVQRLDHPLSQWFAPLAAGDTGAMDLAQMRCSASVATGVINFVIGHPIAWMPMVAGNFTCLADGINSAFNLTRIFDDAALAFLDVNSGSTTVVTANGMFQTVAG